MLNLYILCYNGSLVIWTVVSLTTAKFKPLIFPMSAFTFSYSANMFILMILYDLCLLPAQFCYTRIDVYIRKVQSHVQTADWCAPWKISSGADQPIFQFQNQNNFTTGSLLPIILSWRQAPWDSRPIIFHLNTWGYSPRVTSSLTRGSVCRLQLLLALASAAIVGSDYRGTHGHISLSQIWDSFNLEGQVLVFISRNRVARL
jgi:hypothetical protein